MEENFPFFQQKLDAVGVAGAIALYGSRYLRKPTWSDIQQIYAVHEYVHGFPGTLGSIDCTHWEWQNCPTAWRGSHQRGDHHHPTIIDGVAPGSSFYANDTYYKYGYYLADGIYPEYATFVKSFTCPREDDDKRKYFKKAQEAARKDVERAFGVLKKKWHMIDNPYKGKAICQNYEEVNPPVQEVTPEERVEIRAEIRSREIHNILKGDLVEHVWKNRGENL
ncbi:hypothetical protein E3N88_10954 [Mikania micrantha]|uniref:DDE Tnp4 domain-containing protein n=1 Tax=Mikania micrantha TaxID=192012 RepID=A0A5N6PCE0_9ASTR|nr:hypothetical protein E3N88_10954 [Mikania micrantha]